MVYLPSDHNSLACAHSTQDSPVVSHSSVSQGQKCFISKMRRIQVVMAMGYLLDLFQHLGEAKGISESHTAGKSFQVMHRGIKKVTDLPKVTQDVCGRA